MITSPNIFSLSYDSSFQYLYISNHVGSNLYIRWPIKVYPPTTNANIIIKCIKSLYKYFQILLSSIYKFHY
jgi:hypothetical protein